MAWGGTAFSRFNDLETMRGQQKNHMQSLKVITGNLGDYLGTPMYKKAKKSPTQLGEAFHISH
jgi:hypothetical protein